MTNPGVTVKMVRNSVLGADAVVSVQVPMEVVAAGSGFSFAMPQEIASLLQSSTKVSITMDDGTAPSWLKFDPLTGMFGIVVLPNQEFPIQLILTVDKKRTLIVISDGAN